jgi:hypothetical protein
MEKRLNSQQKRRKLCCETTKTIIIHYINQWKNKQKNVNLKGTKYRIPSEIDFTACSQIAESIEDFSIKWFRREKCG